MQGFESVPGGGVALVVAPPGAGKSVLMEQWVGNKDACWLSLSEAHNDAFLLAGEIVAGLHDAHGTFDLTIAGLAMSGGSRLGRTFTDALVSELADLSDPVLLVLDDLHEVTNADVLAEVGQLLLRLPDNVRVIVSSRWDLPLGLGRMRLQGHLIEVRAADLAFELGEATAMLELASGRTMPHRQVRTLVDRTEGWAAGLQLAALSLANEQDADAFIDRFAGDDRLVVDYLTGTILQQLDERTRSFLLQISVLDWMTPELCTAVTADEDARSILLRLVDHGFFMSRVGPGRFRLHQLIAGVLRYQLAVEDPTAEADCRRRAAAWLLSHREYESGIDQLLVVGDHEDAFEVLATQGHRLFESGKTATLVRALSQVYESIGAAGTDVAIHLLAAQVTADEFNAAGETYRELTMRADLTPGERIAIDVLASILGLGHLPLGEMKRLAEGALLSLSEPEPKSVPNFLGFGGNESCQTVAAYCSAMAAFLMGDLEPCALELEQALELPGAKYPLWRINLLGMLSLTRAWQGQLTEGEALALAALDTARDVRAMDHVDTFCAQLSLAIVNVDRLQFGPAGMHLDAATSAARRCRRATYDQLLHVVWVRYLAVTEGAEVALVRLLNEVPHGTLRPLVKKNLRELHAQLLVRSGSLRKAQSLLASGSHLGPAASIDVLLAHGNVASARKMLKGWDPPPSDLRTSLNRDLRRAVIAHYDGRVGTAGTMVADAALHADVQGLLEPFVDAPVVLGLLRTMAPAQRPPRIGTLLDDTLPTEVRVSGNKPLIEQLTPREMVVLGYLPSRLGNEQIADALYVSVNTVSVNTLKTHLRNIYRKLDAQGRDDAVARAGSLGLI